jgi:hypothetical protein
VLKGTVFQLYNLKEDIGEHNDIQHPKEVEKSRLCEKNGTLKLIDPIFFDGLKIQRLKK